MEDIETGNVANQADSAVMNAILSDMNALPEEVQPPPQHQTYMPPPQQQQQPMSDVPMHDFQIPVTEPYMSYSDPFPTHATMQPSFDMYTPEPTQNTAEPVVVKQNAWSGVFAHLTDAVVVAIVVCILSLPVIHTRLTARIPWAYKVGGELSWTGLAFVSVLGGLLFAGYRFLVTNTKILDFIGTL